jgi:hypothetical protein
MLENLGVNDTDFNYLNGITADGEVDLAPITEDPYSGTKWRVSVVPSTPSGPPLAEEFGDYDPIGAAPQFVTPEFLDEVFAIAGRINTAPEYLMAVMGHETGTETPYDPAAESPDGAVGLIQILPENAIAMGTSAEALAAMETAVEQLPYVEQWYSSPEFSGDFSSLGDKTLEDAYLAVFAPSRIGEEDIYIEGTPEYEANQGLDEDGNGVITAQEATDSVREFLPASELFAEYRAPATV